MNNTPVFIKIDAYNEVLDIIDVVKAKMDKCKDILEEIDQLKVEEDEQVMDWKNIIENISEKVSFIDKTLFEPDI